MDVSGAVSNLLKEKAHANVVWVQFYVIMEAGMLVGSDPHPARTWDKKCPEMGLAVTAVACILPILVVRGGSRSPLEHQHGALEQCTEPLNAHVGSCKEVVTSS